MTYQIALSEEEYTALVAASARSGEPIERLVHEAIMSRYAPLSPSGEVGSYQYPTDELDTPADEAEDAYLAMSLAPGKALSQIVLEDRGPC